MRGIRSLAAFAAAALVGVAYAQIGALAPRFSSWSGASPEVIAYAAFQSDLSHLASMQVTSAADVDAALDRAARHDRDAMVRGWMSYAADVAAQSAPFVESVRQAERRWGPNMVTRITSNRSFIRRLPGNEDAIDLVLSALASDAARVAAVAERHRVFAYSLQSQPWGGAVAEKRDERLQRIRGLGRPSGFAPAISPSMAAQLAVSPISIGPGEAAFGGRRFWDAVNGGPPVFEAGSPLSGQLPTHWRADEARPETLDAILSVAALRVLGAQQSQASAIGYFLRDPRAVGCVEMARLEFYSCLSAVHFVYENEYCLAEHGLRDVAMCIGAPIQHDEAYVSAFAVQGTPASFAAVAEAAIVHVAVSAPAAPAPEPGPALEGGVEQSEATSLPGTAEAPSASPVVVVEPPPAVATSVVTPVTEAPAAAPSANAALTASLGDMGAGELFARADELDEQGQADQARLVRRSLIARFPDSPLALLAAQRLAGSRQH